jgi:inositol polyphosphate 5-phosphatase INPP5B/F
MIQGMLSLNSSEKKRCPAWCDRILWLKNPIVEENLICTSYNSCHGMISSDHKPVSASFIAQVRNIDINIRNQVGGEVTRLLDKLENEAMPILNVDTNILNFGKITALSPHSLNFRFTNTGRVIAKFLLVPKMNVESTVRPWITVNPTVGSIFPGEYFDINVKIFVSTAHVKALNIGLENLDDIIIFHIENGQDYFISISAEWIPSCFGESINTLLALDKPIVSYSTAELHSYSTAELDSVLIPDAHFESVQDPQDLNSRFGVEDAAVPKELWTLIDYIYKNGLEVVSTFLNNRIIFSCGLEILWLMNILEIASIQG